MTELTYTKLRVTLNHRVAKVVIDNPPINVLDVTLMGEVRHLLASLHNDPEIRVIVFESADPEFFVAHVDMTLGEQPEALKALQRDVPTGLNPFQAFAEALRAQSQVTIVKLAGRARGGGAEFVAAADMAFGAEGRAGLAQCEALMGIIPGGGATQYLSQRMTRGRALEVILGADLFDARTAERYGWINRALPADELDDFVTRIAENIAALPDGVIAAAKQAVPHIVPGDGFERESKAWMDLIFRPAVGQLMTDQLKAGAQTRDGERDLESLLRGVIARSA
ncbi:enoyl-CoA hydratase/isomerase family protein [Sphingomonas prati]|uniref:Enoyl-CoA hydratase/carnithine racemase n=1 Tax=Sphingomonas prati TaxID=1843237 RepID=A0A7W9F2Q9_9SPHN|nr:enoyl-CoA hydratase/isomerase family protein [Sphingomonas prati]MBB5729034.1 enoyl-CoA hydratase/carnithine racemase [Sphingomonas prati]GGE85588.1 enoyl-CoA hydratase [Sphingomonas prati]